LADDGQRTRIDHVVDTIQHRSPVNEPGTLPLTAAHRGYSSVNPENTLAAYAAGMLSGADFVEIDVQTTADGVPIVMHDKTVDRTTDGTGDVASLDSAYVAGLEAGSWFSPAFAREPVPKLQQVLDLMRTGPGDLLLEIKERETRPDVYRVVDMVLAAGVEDRVVIQSFDEDVLRFARERAPHVSRGLVRGTLDDDPVAMAEELGVDYYNPSGLALVTRPSVIEELHDAGVGVFVWIVNEPRHWELLTKAGVDGIITDRPGAFIGWKAARS
jgi:glycerophosphoryl diester phosphodiesterase